MNTVSPPTVIPGKRERRGSLARTMFRTLLFFALVPLAVMAIAAYFNARSILRDQAILQMQGLASAQMSSIQKAMELKQTRLKGLVGQADFSSAVQTLLHQKKGSDYYIESQNKIRALLKETGREGAEPIFPQYMVVSLEGEVLAASKPEWESANISDNPLFEALKNSDGKSYSVYNFAPFYSDQLILATVTQYRTSSKVPQAMIVGIDEQEEPVLMLRSLELINPEARAYFITDFGGYISLDRYSGKPLQIVASSEQSQLLTQTLDELKHVIMLRPQTAEFTNEQGNTVIAQVVWIPELNSGIALELPSASIFGRLNNLLPFTGVVLVLLGAAVAAAYSLYTRRVVNPILSLSGTVSQFVEGNLQGKATVQSDNEIGLLADSFNSMADRLRDLYTSLQEQVEERTRQIRTAAEVAQGITTSFNLDELLQRTVHLIVERFGFYHAGIFMIEEGGKTAFLRAAHGPAAEEMLSRGTKHQVGAASIVGWVSANQKARVASDVELDPVHRRNELLPNTRAEVGIPIVLGGVIMGVLDAQSERPNTFDEEMVIVLQTLGNQIAAAIQNATLVDSQQSGAPGLDRMYRAALFIAQATSEAEILEAASRALKESRQPAIILKVGKDALETIMAFNPFLEAQPALAKKIALPAQDIQRRVAGPVLVNDLSKADNVPGALTQLLRENGCQSGAVLPAFANGRIFGLLLIGELPGQPLTSAVIRPYTVIPEIMSATMEKAAALNDSQTRLSQLEALATINNTVLSTSDIQSFYATLQEQISRVIGNYSFVVALYDSKTNSINIPYLFEDGRTDSIDPFPLGEGLTSILIRTKRPLLLSEDTERQALALGAKIHGKPARSWMGVPLLIGEEAIGALIVQDTERERQFDERHLAFMTEAAKQMAGVINNVRLLEQSRRAALQLQTAAEIARDISGSLNLDELLLRAVNLIRERFDFYHASVFLIDMHGEFAVVREATGEAGAQLKRMGHKLGVGSKSIVGYVTGRGETLVVNDTVKDATYYANPILPDTRA
ncbi:MAG: GAF domain-containing protein, partial [Chloroflexota bacterium]